MPALHFADENTEVPADFVEHVHKALDNLKDKQNVVVKLIGYTDDAPLSERNERIYGDALALSKARAHRVALVVQEALKLPDAVITSEGRGASGAAGAQRHRAGTCDESPCRSRSSGTTIRCRNCRKSRRCVRTTTRTKW